MKNEDIMEEEIFELKDLKTVFIGRCEPKEVKRINTAVCKTIDRGESFVDLITGDVYPLNHFSELYFGKLVAFFPEPLLTRVKNGNFANQILKKGFITREDAIYIYNCVNNITVSNQEETLPNNTTLLNQKNYPKEPALFREKELESLMISLALNKKIALITGPSNIGKTSLVDELAYLIQQRKAPEFLQDKKIIELNIANFKNPKKELKEVLSYIKRNKAILFVDGILELSSDNQSFIDILINECERQELKLIISTNDSNYNNSLQNKALKNRFDIINIKELTDAQITEIAKKEFNHQKATRNISLQEIETNLDEIITVLLECTKPNTNTMNLYTYDYNPGFILSIIDKSFAIAQVKSPKTLSINHIIKAIIDDKRINSNKSKKASEILTELKPKQAKPFLKVFKKVGE